MKTCFQLIRLAALVGFMLCCAHIASAQSTNECGDWNCNAGSCEPCHFQSHYCGQGSCGHCDQMCAMLEALPSMTSEEKRTLQIKKAVEMAINPARLTDVGKLLVRPDLIALGTHGMRLPPGHPIIKERPVELAKAKATGVCVGTPKNIALAKYR